MQAKVIRAGGTMVLALALVSAVSACTKKADGEQPAASAGGGGQGRGGPGGGGGQGGRGGAADRPTPVEIETVKRGAVSRTSMISGRVEPIRTVGVVAQLSGVLLKQNMEEGRRVSEGDVLAEIDTRELSAQVRSAEATLAFAKSTFERSEGLFKQQIVTAAEFDRDRAAYESARASLDQLKTRLGFANVAAPITGVITEKRVEAGDIVSPQTRLFTIADVSTLVTRIQVSELEVTSLNVGDRVPISVDALGGERVDGRIRRIFPGADSATRLVPVEVALTSTLNGRVRPGYSIRATFELDQRVDALLVPSRAVSGPAGARAVYLVRNGLIERRGVRTGSDLSGETEILEGLAVGDSVIVSGTTQLREGGKAKVVAPLQDALPQTKTLDSIAGPNRRDSSRPPGARP